MKKFKHILALLLVVTALMGLMTVGAGAATDYQTLEAKALSEMGLFRGYDNSGNNFGLDNTLTREQALALLIRMKGEATAAEAWTGALPYSDVAAGNKLLPYIGYGKDKGYTKGIGDGKFGVGRLAGQQEMTVFALRGLGYSDSKTAGDFTWDTAMSTAVSVGVLETAAINKPFLRSNVVDILMNTLAANVKGQDYDLLSKLMNDGVVSQAQYDKATEILSGKKATDLTAETNKAIDAYNAAMTAYNKVVDAANTLNLGANAAVKKQVDDMSAIIENMTTEINAVTGKNLPFTAVQVKACNDVTASIKSFTIELQKLVDAAKTASKPTARTINVTFVNETTAAFTGFKAYTTDSSSNPETVKSGASTTLQFTVDSAKTPFTVVFTENITKTAYELPFTFNENLKSGATMTVTFSVDETTGEIVYMDTYQ